jgi:UDP-N-acetylmuramoyl-tripeptide--D-alanyl-D-alanine ligase
VPVILFPDPSEGEVDTVQDREGVRCRFGEREVRLPLFGRHHGLNAAAALAVARREGVGGEEALEELTRFRPLPGRGRIAQAGGTTIVDDGYNASPSAVASALASFAEMPLRRRFLVLGEMLELGREAERAHRRLGKQVASLDPDGFFWLGGWADAVEAGWREGGGGEAFRRFEEGEALLNALVSQLRPGDGVLFKASHQLGMEDMAERLRVRLEEER